MWHAHASCNLATLCLLQDDSIRTATVPCYSKCTNACLILCVLVLQLE
jgi:hypothetical protein